MKTIRTISLVTMMIVVSNFAFATKASFAAAKQNLNETIGKTVQDDLPKVGNYLYENQIHKLNNDVKVVFTVNQHREIEVIKIISDNNDAANYVEHLLSNQKIMADSILTGKSFTLNIHVKFSAK